LFKTENIHPDEKKPEELSKSLKLLSEYGYGPTIIQKLLSESHKGLEGTAEDISMRRKVYGSNKRHQRKIRTLCDMLAEVFEDFILKVLIVAAIVSTSLGIIKDGWAHGFQEGAGIVFAILIIIIVSVGNDYTKEKKFQELMSQSDVATSTVIRGGNNVTLDTEEIVVGDILFIETGKQIPADCLVLEATDCSVSEAALTGEPDGLQKEFVDEGNVYTKPDPFLLQASQLEKGQITRALVLAVCDHTNQGRAGLTMNISNEQTPLQKKLDRIAEGIGKLGVLVALLTFIALVITTLIKTFKDDKREFDM
jgi:magnesium-transporting ATPase (P-type)